MKMTFYLKLIVSISLMASIILGQYPSPGHCPKFLQKSWETKFDINKFTGVWYEIERTPNIWEFNWRCVTFNYTRLNDGNIKVVSQGINKWNRTVRVDGLAQTLDPSTPDLMKIILGISPSVPYWIFALEHDNYAVIVSCKDVFYNLFKMEAIWILGRQKNLTETTLDRIHGKIQRYGFNSKMLSKVEQTNCPKN